MAHDLISYLYTQPNIIPLNKSQSLIYMFNLQVVSLTHTLLTHSDLTSVNRVLVVCPLSTVLNWVNEFKMWLKFAEIEYEVDVYELSR